MTTEQPPTSHPIPAKASPYPEGNDATLPRVAPPRRRKPSKLALATLLVQHDYFADTDEAARWIMAGQVLVNEQRIDKPGTPVHVDATIRLRGQRRYASRGGLKLAAALQQFEVNVAGRVALDAGASTGGFTDCLLQHGATHIYAVEVGYGQLVGRLRADPRVQNLERTNLGDLEPAQLLPPPTLITLDLSYLSLTQALPLAARLLIAEQGEVLALLKPLFEVDDADSARSGQISDPALLVAAWQRVLAASESAGLRPQAGVRLALQPRHGVPEFFLHLSNDRSAIPWRPDEKALCDLIASPGVGPLSEDE